MEKSDEINSLPLHLKLLESFAYHAFYSDEQKEKVVEPKLNFFESTLLNIFSFLFLVIVGPICIALRLWAASLTAICYWSANEYSVVNVVVFVALAVMATMIQLMNEDK